MEGIVVEIWGDILRRLNLSKRMQGVEVTRTTNGRAWTDDLIPNSLDAWVTYTNAQPDIRDLKSKSKKLKWIDEKIREGEIVLGRKCLYLDAFELVTGSTDTMITVKKVLLWNQVAKFFTKIIFKIWHDSEGWGDR